MRSLTRSGLRRAVAGNFIAWKPLKGLPRLLWQGFGQGHHLGMGIHSENEFDSLLIPPVQFSGQGKVGVAAQEIRAACGAINLIARSIHDTQPSWLTTLPGRLTK